MRMRRLTTEEGFGLIELMMVVLIIGILISMGLVSMVGSRRRTENRAAETNLRNALIAAKTYLSDNDTYSGFTGTCVAPTRCGQTIEPSLDWTGGNPASVNKISVSQVTSTTVVLTIKAQSGTFYCLKDDSSAAGGQTLGDVDASASTACTGGWPS
jgi:prepilin-type N-terminal cleavage/methylation domain-containing protein